MQLVKITMCNNQSILPLQVGQRVRLRHVRYSGDRHHRATGRCGRQRTGRHQQLLPHRCESGNWGLISFLKIDLFLKNVIFLGKD